MSARAKRFMEKHPGDNPVPFGSTYYHSKLVEEMLEEFHKESMPDNEEAKAIVDEVLRYNEPKSGEYGRAGIAMSAIEYVKNFVRKEKVIEQCSNCKALLTYQPTSVISIDGKTVYNFCDAACFREFIHKSNVPSVGEISMILRKGLQYPKESDIGMKTLTGNQIVKIVPGEGEYRSKILYAELVNGKGELVCSATLEFILIVNRNHSKNIINYADALKTYLEFNEKLRNKES